MAPKQTILIVEDDTFLKDTYSFKLEQEGFTVIGATDGTTALALAKTKLPDLIILDLLLPMINGFEVLKSLRDVDETKSIPVIIASNIDRADAEKSGDISSAQDYLLKAKTSVNELVATCRRVLAAGPIN